nr:MAG TPA: hypothetical protein [Caudoviricetes sp.]DAR97044.1 MAG TPA: hypothetical protein [Caudoviricetes sp.]
MFYDLTSALYGSPLMSFNFSYLNPLTDPYPLPDSFII